MNQLQKLTEWLQSPEGQADMQDFFGKLEEKNAIDEDRIAKIHALTDEQFTALMVRMSNQHGEQWINRCYNEGVEPYPKPLLSLIFTLAERYGKNISDEVFQRDECVFSVSAYEYRGYEFINIFGQGVKSSVLFPYPDQQFSIHL